MASTGVARISLGAGSPPATRTEHYIVVRAKVTSGSGTINAALYEGSSDRSGTLQATLTTSFENYYLGISDAMAASITSYDNLELRIWGSASSSYMFQIAEAALQIPAAGASTTKYGVVSTSFVVGIWANGVIEGEDFYTGVARLSLASGDDPGVHTNHKILLRARTTPDPISFIGYNSAVAASASLPSFQVGDTAFVFAFRDGNDTPPSLPSGWTSLNTELRPSLCSARTGYRVLQAGDTSTGTWTNATEVQVAVLRGVGSDPMGGSNTSGTDTGNQIELEGFELQAINGWRLGFAGHRTATNVNTGTIAGWTTRSTGGAATSLGCHTDSTPSEWDYVNYSVNATAAWLSFNLEVLPAPAGIRAALYEGSNNRSGDLELPALTGSFADYSLAISEANAANITSYSNLEIRLWGFSTYASATFDVASVALGLTEGTSSNTVPVGIASESDSALPVTSFGDLPPLYPGTGVYPSETYYGAGGIVLVGIAVDTDTALPVTASGTALVGLVGIAGDYSYALTREAPTAVPVGIATETSVATEVASEGGAKVISVGIATERNFVGEVGGSGELIIRSVIKDGSEDLVIGARCATYAPLAYTYDSYFQGILDELALLGGPISDQEVQDLYARVRHVGTDGTGYNSSTGIWVGTTNLIPNGGFEGGVSGWSAVNGATLTHETTNVYLGGGSLKVVTDAVGEGATTASLTTDVSQNYVGSVWLSGSGVVRLELEERTSGDTVVGTTNGTSVSLDGSWQRLVVSRAFGGTGAKARLRIIAQSSSATIYADGAQLEKQASATPYVETNGLSATRESARMQASGSYLDETQGWIAARVRAGWGNDAEPGEAKVFDWRDSSSAYLSLYYNTTSNSFVMKRTDGASPATSTVACSLATHDRVTLVAAWTSAGVKLSVNGAAFVAALGTGVPGLSATQFDLGSQGGSSNFWNGDFLWFACGQGTLTDADASLLHDWNDEPPRLHTYPPAALVKFGWDGVDEWGVEAGYTHPLTAGRIRRIFHQPGIKRGSTQIELIDLMERLSTEMGTLSAVSTEYMGEALGRIMDKVGLTDPSLRDLDNGTGGLTRVANDGTRTWIELITDIVLSDYGIFWIDGRGHAIFRERRSRSLASYKGRLSRELRALQPGVDLDRVVNAWTVYAADQGEGVDPIPATAGFSRSQRRYGIRLSDRSAVHLSTYDQAYSLAEHLVRRTSDPDAPVYALTVSNRSDRQLALALGLEVGDMIGVLAEKTIGYYIVEQVAVEANVAEGRHDVSLVLTAL